MAITELDDPPLDELDELLLDEAPPLDEVPLDELDEPPLDEALPLDEPDKPLLDEAPLDELDEPPLDEALPAASSSITLTAPSWPTAFAAWPSRVNRERTSALVESSGCRIFTATRLPLRCVAP